MYAALMRARNPLRSFTHRSLLAGLTLVASLAYTGLAGAESYLQPGVEDVVFGCVDTIGPQAGDIARTAWLAIPVPAEPAPTTTRRRSPTGVPTVPRPATIAATLTAAVPWMSSLNEQM